MRRLVLAVATAAFLSVAPSALAQGPAGEIAGTPLTITTDGLGALQFREGSNPGAFYQPDSDVGHAGLELGTANAYFPLGDREVLAAPVADQDGNVHRLTSQYQAGDLEVTETIHYTDGTRTVDIEYSIRNTGDGQITFRAAELADLYAGGGDSGHVFLANTTSQVIGGVGADGSVVGIEQVTPWDNYEAGNYNSVFDDSASGGLSDVVDPNETDDGVGVEWDDITLSGGETADPIQVRWRVGGNPHVNTTRDDDDTQCSAADCTLREALAHSTAGSIVTVPVGDYNLPLGHLPVDNDVTIIGERAANTTIHGPAADRVMTVASGVTAELAGVTLADGHIGADQGGGVVVRSGGTLRLADAAVANNHGGQGAGIFSLGRLDIERSTLSGNASTDGGAVYLSGGSAAIDNSTISGNVADAHGGGIYAAAPLTLTNVTLADNQGAGIYENVGAATKTTAVNTLFARNGGGSCDGTPNAIVAGHALFDDAPCPLDAGSANNLTSTPALINGLDEWGGPTNTHQILPGSPALDGGDPDACGVFDQRGFPRTIGVRCDIGATESNGGSLIVALRVVNDGGGQAEPGDFTIHVRRGATNVVTDFGDEFGNQYLVPVGHYQVSADPKSGYTLSYRGDCVDSGAMDVFEFGGPECVITADDTGAPQQQTAQATLTVVTQVAGGAKGPGDFAVHVRQGGADIGGSPRAGSASGTTYTVAPGAYSVAADPPTAYAASVGGACAASGAVTLAAGEAKTCTITGTPPEAHHSAVAEPVSGTVKVKRPGKKGFVTLKAGEPIPLGTTVDTRNGRVTISAAADDKGGTATADFYDGLFRVGQTKGKKPITELTLVEKLTCSAKKASAAKKKVRKRRLWGDGHGHFRTTGRHSAATVVGTKWLVQDSCSSTLTKVARGIVSVRDFAKKKTVKVKAGHQYVARAKTH
jgi:CSLREA domain-containing protein